MLGFCEIVMAGLDGRWGTTHPIMLYAVISVPDQAACNRANSPLSRNA
jgi:hypothetical protein